jgi:leader peptidase (prepilin peptidase) / N-methyltransferase
MLFTYILAAVGGFLVGVLVNLIADYAPARRYSREAARSPFVSRDAVPAVPPFLPRAPITAWSGWGARLTGQMPFTSARWSRRLIVELVLPVVYVWITATFGHEPRYPFMLVYAPLLLLIAIIDIERRWILDSVLVALAGVGLLQTIILNPYGLPTPLRGALYGFGITFGLYLLGIVFGQGIRSLSGRSVGRTVFGFGDVKLGAVGGLLVGWPGIGFALLIMTFTGAIGALTVLFNQIRKRQRLRRFSAIPYAPYIVLGVAVQLYLPVLVGELMIRLR